jgi:receptor-type tyrosine-protein phosphatase beta
MDFMSFCLVKCFRVRTCCVVPDPPANLSINVRQKSHVQFTWDPPVVGGFTKFKLRLIPLSDGGQPRNFIENKAPVTLRDLVAGASYEIQLYTLFENKESTVYISGNFTTS